MRKFIIEEIEGGYLVTISGNIPSQTELMQLFKMDNPMTSFLPLINTLKESKVFCETLDEILLKLKEVFKDE